MAVIPDDVIFGRKNITLGGLKMSIAGVYRDSAINETDYYPQGVNTIAAAFGGNGGDANGFLAFSYVGATAAVAMPRGTSDMVKLGLNVDGIPYTVLVLGY